MTTTTDTLTAPMSDARLQELIRFYDITGGPYPQGPHVQLAIRRAFGDLLQEVCLQRNLDASRLERAMGLLRRYYNDDLKEDRGPRRTSAAQHSEAAALLAEHKQETRP